MKNEIEYSIFSWDPEILSSVYLEDYYDIINDLKIRKIYQNIDGLSHSKVEETIKSLKDNTNADVYSLTGDPTWYSSSKNVISILDNINNYNMYVNKKHQINGIVLDIEPWSLYKDWDREVYIKTIEDIYSYAKSVNIKIINIIPTWLDIKDIETIVKNSDEIAVMNYNISSPIENIKEEIDISKRYNKEINVIAETQAENKKYGVDKNTTYYYLGKDRLDKDWESIIDTYKYKRISFSYHDLNNIINFLEGDE
ncbi:hypothetical protein [Faecalimicrobium dakarense]|uniref:hypothetical protein n=1 Tax=Faecalimicrobium dakarense TaxID=1301100 RepID=UPI0005A64D49|nr:hypothetical protein [[Clostridium] dakarense]